MRDRIVSALAITLFVVVFAFPSEPLFAGSVPASCAGTYLIAEDGGARDFWTFAADGSFFGTTSTQPLFNFSNQQGSWTKDGNAGARGVLFAFVYNSDNTLNSTARIDITFQSQGHGCEGITGSLVVRTFEDGEDPLDPATDTGDPIASDTFTGRRVQIRP